MEFELIKDNELIKDAFKNKAKQMEWQYTIKKYGNKEHTYYVGKYEDDEKIMVVKIRPSRTMSVMESYKNYSSQGKIVEHGTSVEVRISEDFLKKLIKMVKPSLIKSTCSKMEW